MAGFGVFRRSAQRALLKVDIRTRRARSLRKERKRTSLQEMLFLRLLRALCALCVLVVRSLVDLHQPQEMFTVMRKLVDRFVDVGEGRVQLPLLERGVHLR